MHGVEDSSTSFNVGACRILCPPRLRLPNLLLVLCQKASFRRAFPEPLLPVPPGAGVSSVPAHLRTLSCARKSRSWLASGGSKGLLQLGPLKGLRRAPFACFANGGRRDWATPCPHHSQSLCGDVLINAYGLMASNWSEHHVA